MGYARAGRTVERVFQPIQKKIYHPRPFGTAGEARFMGVWDDESHLRVARMRNEDSRAPRDLQDTRLWEEALSKVLARIEATASTIKHGYPHYADTNTGRWTVSENGDWTGRRLRALGGSPH
jgi:hypothetical protein